MQSKAWTIDTAHSGIHFSVRHLVVAKVRGRFGVWNGTLHLDEQDPTRSHVEVAIEAGSIDTGVVDRDQHLRSPDFLDVGQFPELRFASTAVQPLGGDRYRVRGDLTIRDVTRDGAGLQANLPAYPWSFRN